MAIKRAVRGDAATFPVYVEGTPRDLHPILWDAVNRIAEGCCVTRSARRGAGTEVELSVPAPVAYGTSAVRPPGA